METGREDNLFERLITSYYEKRNIPKNIICPLDYEENEDVIKGWAKIEKHKDIKMYFPKINSRRYQLLEMGFLNLNEEVERYYRQKKNVQEGLNNLRKTWRLKKRPYS